MTIVYARRQGLPNERDLSSQGREPYRRLSPFVTHGGIPVPGRIARCLFSELGAAELEASRPEDFASSVEGIWQGLKLLGDGADFSLLRGRPRKRRGAPRGHDFGYRVLGYAEARALLYVPAYLFVLRRRAAEVVELLRREGADGDIALVDVSFSPELVSLARPLSHSRLVAGYLAGELEPYLEAERRLDAEAAEMLAIHEQGAAGSTDWAQTLGAWIGACSDEVLALADRARPMDTIAAWAALHEQHERMLLVIAGAAGSHLQLDDARRALDRWVAAGVLTAPEARALSLCSPVCRFSEDWYRPAT